MWFERTMQGIAGGIAFTAGAACVGLGYLLWEDNNKASSVDRECFVLAGLAALAAASFVKLIQDEIARRAAAAWAPGLHFFQPPPPIPPRHPRHRRQAQPQQRFGMAAPAA